jgi:hypothetical protein
MRGRFVCEWDTTRANAAWERAVADNRARGATEPAAEV